MAIKSNFAFSNNCYIELLNMINDVLPKNHKMLKDMYQSKKILSALSMEYEKINVCKDNCMLFYKEHEDGEKVTMKVAHKQLHYMPIMSQMKQLFLSKKITRHMRWHKEDARENNQVIVHPSDSEASKALDILMQTSPGVQEMFALGWQHMHSYLTIQVRYRTLVGPSLLFRTTFYLLFA
jgi:hypothetical protein